MDKISLQELYRKISNELCNRNGYVVEFNKTITCLTGCNTAAMMLGNAMQSKSALFYLSDYFAKNKVELSHVLSTLEESRRHIDSHPSLADDAGSTTRTVQHWLTRTANSLTSSSEVADTQAVAALIKKKKKILSLPLNVFDWLEFMSVYILYGTKGLTMKHSPTPWIRAIQKGMVIYQMMDL